MNKLFLLNKREHLYDGRGEYKELFAGEKYDRRQKQIYGDVIIPQRYDRIEDILRVYLELS